MHTKKAINADDYVGHTMAREDEANIGRQEAEQIKFENPARSVLFPQSSGFTDYHTVLQKTCRRERVSVVTTSLA